LPPQKLKHPLQCLGVNIPVNANATVAVKLNLVRAAQEATAAAAVCTSRQEPA